MRLSERDQFAPGQWAVPLSSDLIPRPRMITRSAAVDLREDFSNYAAMDVCQAKVATGVAERKTLVIKP